MRGIIEKAYYLQDMNEMHASGFRSGDTINFFITPERACGTVLRDGKAMPFEIEKPVVRVLENKIFIEGMQRATGVFYRRYGMAILIVAES